MCVQPYPDSAVCRRLTHLPKTPTYTGHLISQPAWVLLVSRTDSYMSPLMGHLRNDLTSLSGPSTERRSTSLFYSDSVLVSPSSPTRSSNATTKAGRSSISSRWRSFPLRASSWSSLRANDRSRGVSEDRARSSRHAAFDRVQVWSGLSQSCRVDAVLKKKENGACFAAARTDSERSSNWTTLTIHLPSAASR